MKIQLRVMCGRGKKKMAGNIKHFSSCNVTVEEEMVIKVKKLERSMKKLYKGCLYKILKNFVQ